MSYTVSRTKFALDQARRETIELRPFERMDCAVFARLRSQNRSSARSSVNAFNAHRSSMYASLESDLEIILVSRRFEPSTQELAKSDRKDIVTLACCKPCPQCASAAVVCAKARRVQ
jgi:hypothetical protein